MDLNKMLNMTNNEVYGLDIGSSAVKIVALRQDDAGYTVTAAGISQISHRQSRAPGQSIWQSGADTSIVRAIRDCLASAKLSTKDKFRSKFAVCGVSGPDVAVRDFEFPPLPDEEVNGAVFFEASLVCPFNIEQAAVDYQLMPNGGADSKSQNDAEYSEKTRGVLVATTNNFLTAKVRLAKEAGLKCVLMDVDGLALLNCFNNIVGKDQMGTTAILNVGGSCTTLAIMNDGGWPFIRDINCAGDYIIDRITEGGDISSEEIIKVLFDNNPTAIGDRLEKACEGLIADIAETLRFYAAGEKSTPVNKIFVCGGFAPAKDFAELLNSHLGVEVRLWNPFDKLRSNMSEHCKDIFTKTGPAMAVATGLAMRSIEVARRS